MIASPPISRRALLRRGLAGGGAILASGCAVSAVAALPAFASGAPDGDLAALRLLVGAELLALDFHSRALAAGTLGPRAKATLRRMRADEQAHYAGLADLISQAGQPPATAADVDFAYPGGAFTGESAILKLAAELESVQLGAYVGANATVEAPQLRVALGQIAANEAQHVAALAALAGKPVIGRAFGPALGAEAVTAFLDSYES